MAGCFENALFKTPGIQGQVVLKWVIQPNGQAEDFVVVSSEVKDPELEACLIDEVKKVHFPGFEVKQSVLYPFVFKKK